MRFFLIYLSCVVLISVLSIALGAITVAENCGLHAFDLEVFYQEGQCKVPQSPSRIFRAVTVNGGIAGVMFVTLGNIYLLISENFKRRRL